MIFVLSITGIEMNASQVASVALGSLGALGAFLDAPGSGMFLGFALASVFFFFLQKAFCGKCKP